MLELFFVLMLNEFDEFSFGISRILVSVDNVVVAYGYATVVIVVGCEIIACVVD